MSLEHLAGVTSSEASGFHLMFIDSEGAPDAIISSSLQRITLLLPTFNAAGEFVLDLTVNFQHMNAIPGNYASTGWICCLLVGELCIENSLFETTVIPLDP